MALSARDLGAQLVDHLRGTQIRVPPYPAVALALQRMSRDGTSLAEIAAVVATDPAVAANVLRRAGSAAWGPHGSTVSLETAISRLGFDELVGFVTALSLGQTAHAPGPLAELRRDQWRRALLAAMFCKALAPRRGLDPDQAFLAGLLHDFGAVVAVTCLESAGGLPSFPMATWRRIVDDVHLELGNVVATRWDLPEPIREAIAHHHTPTGCARLFRPLVQLIAIVDEVLAALDRDPAAGIAALIEIHGVDHDERFLIAALMPKVGDQMAQFEGAPSARRAPSAVAPAPMVDESWPVTFAVSDGASLGYRASRMAAQWISFVSPVELEVGWLTDLVVGDLPSAIPMLGNVKSCEPAPGGFLVTAQPFGLGSLEQAAWRDLAARTRPDVHLSR